MSNQLEMIRDAPAQWYIDVVLPPPDTLVGKILTLTAKALSSDPNTTNQFQKTSPSGGIVVTGDLTAVASVDAADTVSLANLREQILVWNLIMTSGSDDYPLADGSLLVNGNPKFAIVEVE